MRSCEEQVQNEMKEMGFKDGKIMRAMRLKKREVTDKKVLGEILEECDVVRIGAVDEEGMFIVPVNFGYDFDTGEETTRLVLYFHGAAEAERRKHLPLIRMLQWKWTAVTN